MNRIDAIQDSTSIGLRLSGVLTLALLTACGGGGSGTVTGSSGTATPTPSTGSTPSPSPSPTLTAVEFSRQMSPGWNLGNSLEAMGSGSAPAATSQETAWGNPATTQALMTAVKAAGFKSIRIPVSWNQYANASNNISPAWMARVTEVVNYARSAGLYVVINIHWDGGWMQPTSAQQVAVNAKLTKFWTQIATNFRDSDERLLFAGTNEVMVKDVYSAPTAENCAVQNSFNQTFVNAVRATGGNNATRYLVVQGYNTNIDYTLSCNATMPADSAVKRMMMEIHYYDPYNFTLNTSSSIWQWGATATTPSATETWANEAYTDAQFQKMKVNFIDKGVPVILGEYAASLRTEYDPAGTYRTRWNSYITQSAHQRGLVPMYWDNGYPTNHQSGLFNRGAATSAYPDAIKAIVDAAP